MRVTDIIKEQVSSYGDAQMPCYWLLDLPRRSLSRRHQGERRAELHLISGFES